MYVGDITVEQRFVGSVILRVEARVRLPDHRTILTNIFYVKDSFRGYMLDSYTHRSALSLGSITSVDKIIIEKTIYLREKELAICPTGKTIKGPDSFEDIALNLQMFLR